MFNFGSMGFGLGQSSSGLLGWGFNFPQAIIAIKKSMSIYWGELWQPRARIKIQKSSLGMELNKPQSSLRIKKPEIEFLLK